MKKLSVLISSAGRRVELLRGFRAALDALGVDGRVLAADRSWYSSAVHSADAHYRVPACDAPDFVPRMLELCATQGVDLVVPTIDPELPVLAGVRDDFAAIGTTVSISSPEVVAIAADKRITHDWLATHGFPTVRQSTVAEVEGDPTAWPFPLLVKPRLGSAGHGVAVVRDPVELQVAARDGDVVVETLAMGAEHTVDALVDRSGRCVCAVPRQRIEVRAGEVAKAVTVRAPTLERLAVDVCDTLPGAYGAITIQAFVGERPDDIAIIELNARFGGGFPLSREAGAYYPRWLLEELIGLPSTARSDGWEPGLVMLRYDAAVFVREGEDAGA
jgi:carbamoyl-phosphate synthase large subunit